MEPNRKGFEQYCRHVNALADQVAGWCSEQQWSVSVAPKPMDEPPYGKHEVNFVRFRAPRGEVHLDPIAYSIMGGGDGRVDLVSWTTGERYVLILRGDEWTIFDDQLRRVRRQLNRATFFILVNKLLESNAA